jgi:hypothetical protein
MEHQGGVLSLSSFLLLVAEGMHLTLTCAVLLPIVQFLLAENTMQDQYF